MKAIPTKKKKAAIIVRRKPFDKVDEQTKIKIVEEIKTGMISCLGPAENTAFQGIPSKHGRVSLI